MDREDYTHGEKPSSRAMTPTDNQELPLYDTSGVKEEPHDIEQSLSYDEEEIDHTELALNTHTR